MEEALRRVVQEEAGVARPLVFRKRFVASIEADWSAVEPKVASVEVLKEPWRSQSSGSLQKKYVINQWVDSF